MDGTDMKEQPVKIEAKNNATKFDGLPEQFNV
jgi:hypothetical protein